MKKKLLTAALSFIFMGLILSCGQQKNKDLLSQAEYTKQYLAAMEQRLPSHKFQIVGNLEIHSADSNIHYLDNSYRAYTQAPEEINQIMTDYLNATMNIYEKDKSYSKEHIVPVLKPRKYLDDLSAIQAPAIYHENFTEDIIISYAHDSEHNLAYLTKDDLDSMHVHSDTLKNYALKNLKRILPEIQKVGDDKHFGLIAGGTFESSILLLTDFWTKENFPVAGAIVVACPTRDMLYVVGSNDLQGIEKLRITAQKSYDEDNYQVSPYLYKFIQGKFVRF